MSTKAVEAKRSAKHRDKMRDRGYLYATYKIPGHLKAEFDGLVRFAIAQHEADLLLDMEFQRIGQLVGMPEATTH